MPELAGYAHVAITVSDLATSIPFYTTVFETDPVGEIATDAFVRKLFPVGNDQIMGVTQYTAPKDARFDYRNPGLDHVGLAVATAADVLAIDERLRAAGIEGDVEDAPFGTTLMLKDPDGTQIEFFSAEKRS